MPVARVIPVMDLRELVRGEVGGERLARVVEELAARYGLDEPDVRRLDADNWLSTPLALDDRYFVKVITRQNSVVHALFTTGRNLGAFSSGSGAFFEHFDTPYDMARHELEATARMREVGVNAPEPVEALEIDGLGVVVLEYLPAFRTLDELDEASERERAPELFDALRRMHDAGLAHGDFRAENVLIREDGVYFIDATKLADDEAARDAARSYDLACALGALAPLIGARAAVEAAATRYSPAELLAAEGFLAFVSLRPEHSFDARAVESEIERLVVDPGPGSEGDDAQATDSPRDPEPGRVDDASVVPGVGGIDVDVDVDVDAPDVDVLDVDVTVPDVDVPEVDGLTELLSAEDAETEREGT
jgi:hypothetical protein